MYKRNFPNSLDYFEIYYPGKINSNEIFQDESVIEKIFPLKEHRLTVDIDNTTQLMQKFIFTNKDND